MRWLVTVHTCLYFWSSQRCFFLLSAVSQRLAVLSFSSTCKNGCVSLNSVSNFNTYYIVGKIYALPLVDWQVWWELHVFYPLPDNMLYFCIANNRNERSNDKNNNHITHTHTKKKKKKKKKNRNNALILFEKFILHTSFSM